MAITQSQFSQSVAERLNSTGEWELRRREVDEVLDAVREELIAQLKKKENKNANGVASVPLRGIGRVRLRPTKAKKARKGRNPATGEEITIGAKKAGKRASVTIARDFKQAVGVK